MDTRRMAAMGRGYDGAVFFLAAGGRVSESVPASSFIMQSLSAFVSFQKQD
jgi:hypothetical protein